MKLLRQRASLAPKVEVAVHRRPAGADDLPDISRREPLGLEVLRSFYPDMLGGDFSPAGFPPMLRGHKPLGVETLDVPDVRGMNRLLTREIARWAYSSLDDEGIYNYSGIRYVSKLDNEECWAIFSGTETFIHEQTTIMKTDPSLLDVARLFSLSIH